MIHAAMQAAIEEARTLAQMDDASRRLWLEHGAGRLGDTEAQRLAERLEERRVAIRDAGPQAVGMTSGRTSLFPPRRRSVSPDKLASRDRRRLLASAGGMPPALASRFTEGQRAVLKVLADEIAAKGACNLYIDAIAARAGVGVRLTQIAIRLAEGDGMLTVEERRHRGRKNSPNLVRIINREWQAWIRRGARQQPARLIPPGSMSQAGTTPSAIGCRALHPTDSRLLYTDKTEDSGAVVKLPEDENRSQDRVLRGTSRVAESAQAVVQNQGLSRAGEFQRPEPQRQSSAR